MTFPLDDTIAAIASAPGGAARGIVRLSGPAVAACLQSCFAARDGARRLTAAQPSAISGELLLPQPLAPLPCVLYFWPTDRSYTRQPAAELHTFGSPPLLEAALTAVCLAGARLAEPGEFTLRAFLAGRLDLTQAEAVLGVIDAENRRELDIALRQLAGGLAAPLDAIRDRLLDLLAHLEAALDFVEEDIEFISAGELDRQLHDAAAAVRRTAETLATRGEAADAWRVALVGSPNVGKSSLLNALAQQSAALVSSMPGTTRDYLCRRVTWGNTVVELIDTAGVEPDATDAIAVAAQTMAQEQTAQAHVTLLCLDRSRPLNAWESRQLSALHVDASQPHSPRLVVLTKSDLPPMVNCETTNLTVSSVTGAGLDELRRQIQQAIIQTRGEATVVAGTAVRCRESLRLAAECLERAREAAQGQLGEELVAAEVRTALDELGKVAGRVYTDDVLDRIFSRFCIGK